MIHPASRTWTAEDIALLKRLSQEGASVNRAAAALNRKTTAVRKVAKRHGVILAGTRKLKAAIRALDLKASFTSRH